MLDIKLIRKQPEKVKTKLQSKGCEEFDDFIALDNRVRSCKQREEELKAECNRQSALIGQKKAQGEEATALMEAVKEQKKTLATLEAERKTVEEQWKMQLLSLPNLPFDEVKVSLNCDENVVIQEHKSKPAFSFRPKHHLELNETLQLFDFKRGAKMSGMGWPVYHHWGARLEWALINYMLEIHLKKGFTMWMTPAVVRAQMLEGAGQLPKFQDQQYMLKGEESDFALIPTAEVSLNALHYDEELAAENLPLRYVAYTPCFRREAGAAGKKERGLIRTHQFNKVEMFVYCLPEQGEAEFQAMLASAEEVLQGLELHYRNMLLVTGDTSFPAAKTVDCEVWLPGQDRYYEVSSISYCTDFQARRSRIKSVRGQEKEFVHTLNGSGLATSRLMVALLENNQTENGDVIIPSVLRKYLDGRERLSPA